MNHSIALKNRFMEIFRNKLFLMILIAFVMGTLLTLGLSLTFVISPELKSDIQQYGQGNTFTELSIDFWMISIMFPYFSFFSTLFIYSLFFIIATYVPAFLTKFIWKPGKHSNLSFIIGSYIIGISIFVVYWLINGWFTKAVIFFYLAPFTNLSIPLAAFLFFRSLKKNRLANAISEREHSVLTDDSTERDLKS